MSAIWNAFTGVIESALVAINGVLSFLGENSWGWSVIALTVVVRLLLLPLAAKQMKSMKAMQTLAPKQKAIQKKYPADREMMRTDPEKYRARKQKQQEEIFALYKEEGVNPASGCLPLIAQMPIFFGLFSVLRSAPELTDAPFYFLTSGIETTAEQTAAGLGAPTTAAGIAGFALLLLMAGSMFISQRQMMSRNPAMEGQAAQQQKIVMYVMPVVLVFIGQSLPLGVLLYWVTSNFWQMGQQAYIMRETKAVESVPSTKPSTPSKSATSGKKPVDARPSTSNAKNNAKKAGAKPSKGQQKPSQNGSGPRSNGSSTGKRSGSTAQSSHLPGSKRKR